MIVLFAGICNILLNQFLTPQFGWIGASWANVIAKSIAVGLTFILALHYYRIVFDVKRILSIGLLLVFLSSLYSFGSELLDGLFGFSIRLFALIASLLILIFPLKLVTNQEWKTISGTFARLLARSR